MQTGSYHHRNPYSQQPNANGVNPNNGIIVDGGSAPHINGDASPNTINVDPYNGNNDDLQSQQPVSPFNQVNSSNEERRT